MTYLCLDIADAPAILEKDAQVVDIRDLASFQTSHITDAVHLHNDNLADYVQQANKNAPLIVCCYHGNSSKNAAEYLATQGFREVYSLNGGFSQWSVTFPAQCT